MQIWCSVALAQDTCRAHMVREARRLGVRVPPRTQQGQKICDVRIIYIIRLFPYNIRIASMKKLPAKPTLKDFQKYVKFKIKERGFDHETLPEVFMLLFEECGELAHAARKLSNVKTDPASKKRIAEEEVVDVLWYLIDICNYLNIDLEKAFRAKEKINEKRVWK